MSKKHRTKTKNEAYKQAGPDGRAAAQCGPGASARGKACRATNGHNGANGSNGATPDPQRYQETVKPSAARPTGRRGQESDEAPLEEPLRKGDMVVIRMRSDWELEGELRAINDEVVRIFDFAVCDVLRLRRKDIARIERLVDAD